MTKKFEVSGIEIASGSDEDYEELDLRNAPPEIQQMFVAAFAEAWANGQIAITPEAKDALKEDGVTVDDIAKEMLAHFQKMN